MLPGTIGVLMATEAMKLLLGGGNPLVGRLMTYDSMSMKFQEFKVNRDHDCSLGVDCEGAWRIVVTFSRWPAKPIGQHFRIVNRGDLF